jgi:hypothetical protein
LKIHHQITFAATAGFEILCIKYTTKSVNDERLETCGNLRLRENLTCFRFSGTVTFTGNEFRYVPDAGFVGTELVTYKASDGLTDGDATATITIDVTNTAPNQTRRRPSWVCRSRSTSPAAMPKAIRSH